MKNRKGNLSVALALLALSTLNLQLSTLYAQDTAFTYQGRVTDNGTNFTGAGQFEFALVTSTNVNHMATATAKAPSGGYITGYNLISAGKGYSGSTAAMTITGGGGSGAAAHANISGGMVTSITVDNPGNGLYTSTPTVTIAAPPANITYTTYWSNDGTSVAGSEPSAAVNVTVNSGLFTVVLGDTTLPNMAAISASLFNQPDLQLRIWFNDGVNGFAALDPAQNLTPAPYAVNAANGLVIQQNSDGAPNVIGGASDNYVSSGVLGATIGGGGCVNDLYSIVYSNSVTAAFFGTVGGGGGNVAAGNFATVGGGQDNVASGSDATVPGGYGNVASDSDATVGGGEGNKASNSSATVGGGEYNTASGDYATVPGGEENLASGEFSFAAGQDAQALNQGAFVWADSQSAFYSSDRNDEFKIRAGGGVQMDVSGSSGLNPAAVTINSTSANGVGLHISLAGGSSDAALVLGNSGTGDIIKGFSGASANTLVFEVQNDGTVKSKGVVLTSDRNAKANFTSLDAKAILAKIIAMPVTEWNYKDDAVDKKHIGPMAQDFHAAFGLDGADDKHISVVDEDGVALAAIQGLNEKLEVKSEKLETGNAKLQAQVADLRSQLESLQKAVARLADKSDGSLALNTQPQEAK